MLVHLSLFAVILLFSQHTLASGYTATCYWGARFDDEGKHVELIEQISNDRCHPSDLDQFESAYTADCPIGYGQYGPVVGGVMSKSDRTTYYLSQLTCLKPPRPYRPWQPDSDPTVASRSAESFFTGVYANIHFGLDAAMIDPAMKVSLKELAAFVRGAPDTQVVVIGHTDSQGKASYNLKLSKRRAESVSSYLQWLGITRDRMVIYGLGEELPIASNATVEGRRENRRVTIQVQEKN